MSSQIKITYNQDADKIKVTTTPGWNKMSNLQKADALRDAVHEIGLMYEAAVEALHEVGI